MANVYLSDNANISAADTLIQQHEFEAGFEPLSSVEGHVPSITIPEGTAAGKYYVGVILGLCRCQSGHLLVLQAYPLI